MEPLGALSARLWGAEKLGAGAGQTPSGSGEPAYDYLEKCMKNRELQRALTGNETVGVEPDYEIRMDVWLEPGRETGSAAGQWQDTRDETGVPQMRDGHPDAPREQVIAEGDCAYGRWAFYAAEPETGKVGFAREGRTYTFDYTLPKGRWVNLKLEGKPGKTTLYVDGKEVDSLGSDEPFEEHATFVFPLQRVGSQTGAFDGELDLYV